MPRPWSLTVALLSMIAACGPVELIDDVSVAELQARAIGAACRDAPCGDRPVLVSADTSSELRQALAGLPNEFRYVQDPFSGALLGPDGLYLDGATAMVPSQPYGLGEDAVAVDVWTRRGRLNGLRKTYLFVRDGEGWAETTADDVGVTVTTSVS